MTGSPRVFVALSTHQGEAYVGAQLVSLSNRTHPPDALHVRDDGSTDATAVKLHEFAAHAPFPVVVTEGPRIGLAASLAEVLTAITEIAGDDDLVALCDQDDIWLPTKLARAAARLGPRSPAVAALANGQLGGADGSARPGTTFDAVGFTERARARFARDPVLVLAHRSVATGHALVLRAPVVRAALPFPTAVGGPDAPYPDRWLALVAAGLGPIAVDDDPQVVHRQHDDQLTGVDGRRRVLAGREVVRALRQLTTDRSGTRARLQARADLLAEAAKRTGSASLHAAAEHLARRAALPRRRSARLAPVGHDLAGYRWSGGRRVALADLVRPLG